jgi:callose synthase
MFRILDLLQSREGSGEDTGIFMRVIEPQLFESYGEWRCIHFPLPDSASLSEQIQRFLLLLTVKDSAMDIPENLDARRRLSFFATSLFMDMPDAPKVRNMMSFRSAFTTLP